MAEGDGTTGWLAAALAANSGNSAAQANAIAGTAGGGGANAYSGTSYQSYFPTGSSAPAPSTAPTIAPALNYPQAMPAANIASPVITPVGLNSPGSTPVAQGFELFQIMLENVLKSEQLRQSAVDQTVNISNLFAQLQKASPSQAANLATIMGMPGLEPNLSYANSFAGPGSTGTFGGKVGTQQINLPFAFSGKELSFLGNNPSVASGIADISAALGRPDLFANSAASMIPAGNNLFKF